MSKRFIRSINYMRGLCMLGVIGIHVGSAALSNPTPNLALIGLLEILSRFSVPAFFFLSAFGMFCSQPLSAPFDYGAYLKRRLKTVLLPYITWSFFLYVVYSRSQPQFRYFQSFCRIQNTDIRASHVSHIFSRHSPLVLPSHALVAQAVSLHVKGPLSFLQYSLPGKSGL